MMNSTTTNIVYLENPVSVYDLQKTYNDDVEFITDTENFPMVTAIGYTGRLNKAIKAKTTPKGIKQKVDVLIQHYGDKLKRKWFVAKEDLINQLISVEKMEKGGPGSGRHPEYKININDYVPALETYDENGKGTTIRGKKGDTHFDIWARELATPDEVKNYESYDTSNYSRVGRGFISSKGEWLDHQELQSKTGLGSAEQLRMAQTHKFEETEFEKGGPGSGCQGPTCGRPATSVSEYHQWEEPKRELKIQDVRPAIRYKGKLYLGNKGDTHADVYDKNESEMSSPVVGGGRSGDWKNIEQGFVDNNKNKNWVSREELRQSTGTHLAEDLAYHQELGRLPGRDKNGWLVQKADEETVQEIDEDKEKKKKIIEAILAGLALSLGSTALDVYKQAYMLGKERGVSISGEDFKRTISEEDETKLLNLVDQNQQYLNNFTQELQEKYNEAINTEYASQQAEEAALARIMTGTEARLASYAWAALGALGIGFTAGLGEAEIPEGEQEVSGIIWVTNHDDLVCPGCDDNDGKFFTFDEFEAEYQHNECLTRCRCGETSVPTTAPASHFGKSLKFSKLQKGGPGSGCRGSECGRPKTNFNMMQNQNRRFLYHSDTNSAILSQEKFARIAIGTHAEEHRNAKTGIPYDDYLKGWVGRNSTNYKDGVIHFAPVLAEDYMEDTKGYDNVANTVRYFVDHGANKNTVLRNFKGVREQTIGEAFPELVMSKVEKGGPGSGCNSAVAECGRPKTNFNLKELRPALRFNGQSSDIKIGSKGETHGDIYNRLSDYEMDMNPEGGFVDEDGNWLDRKQLQDYINEHRSDLHTSVWGGSSEDLRTVQSQLETAKKFEEFLSLKKGGECSGSWEAPGQPRFAWTPSEGASAVLDSPEALKPVTKPVNPKGKTSKELHTHENGEWSEERKALHNKIKEDFFKGKTPVEKPVAYLMGGGSASGKSTLLASGKLGIPENTVKVDNDDIKVKLPEYKKMLLAGDYSGAAFTHGESSEVSKDILRDATEGNYNVLLDGTGDSDINKLAEKINIMRNRGATVEAHYVTIDVEEAIIRNIARAEKTGRYVPEPVIRNIYSSISSVVPQAIERGMYDKFTLWDGMDGSTIIATAEGKNLVIHDKVKWEKFVSAKDKV